MMAKAEPKRHKPFALASDIAVIMNTHTGYKAERTVDHRGNAVIIVTMDGLQYRLTITKEM